MLCLPFHFFYAVISLQHEVGIIIIWLVVGGFTGLEDKWGDVVVSENMCVPIIKVDFIDIKVEDMWIHFDSSTGPTEDTYCLHPSIPIHISHRRVVD